MKLADFGLAVGMSYGSNDFVNSFVVFCYIQAHSHIPRYTSVCILYLSDYFFISQIPFIFIVFCMHTKVFQYLPHSSLLQYRCHFLCQVSLHP